MKKLLCFLLILILPRVALCADWSDNPFMKLYKRAAGVEMLRVYDRVADLEKRYEAAKAREQSLANRILGAAAIGATGIGGMELMSGLAQQRADADAERDMTAYLATFKCDYGAGQNIKGGETGIELPGANQLAPLYQEYIALAVDLKARKAALGLVPGIEGEVILDKANMGLYDNASIGKTDGAYTSLSRALMDKDGTDASEWAQQKSDAATKTKTGGIVGGVGAVGGVVGNLIINRDKGSATDK